jgi:hypothetical protein
MQVLLVAEEFKFFLLQKNSLLQQEELEFFCNKKSLNSSVTRRT